MSRAAGGEAMNGKLMLAVATEILAILESEQQAEIERLTAELAWYKEHYKWESIDDAPPKEIRAFEALIVANMRGVDPEKLDKAIEAAERRRKQTLC